MASLPPQDEERFKDIAKQATADLIRNALRLPQLKLLSRIQHKTTARQALVYGGQDIVNPALPLVGAHTFIRSTLSDVADLFQLDTPAKQDAFHATVGSRIASKRKLFSLSQPHATNHAQCDISWFAYNSPVPGMSKRDFCVLESHNEIEIVDHSNIARRGWVRCIHSIDDIATYPSVPNMVRASIARSGLVCIETDTPGLLDVYYVLVPVLTGAGWNIATKRMAKRQVEKILRLEQFLAYQHLDMDCVRVISPSSKRQNAKLCTRCSKTLHLFRPKRQCHRCFEAMCPTCGCEWPLRGKKLFVCHDCFHPGMHDPSSGD
ncbi:hypothetical protein, variant 1 [Aphanomyces invadans]|uniref:FYVE-type domain-containing protein n=1 Tax=Aphanomyces invadans TaxID=157072 RepID=A0A024TTC8_9STRA|nr:hypothetical protein, variant 1 [Aphanomyces invadans]ETV97293.1 hypothetical protein, variant 1 [Aphanomyces invadans]|eukprot:XP_008874002.1 hypothetical protein, variant 1 [Aphanomyces invadans]